MAFRRKAATGLVHVGIRGQVVALRKDTGEIAWSAKLRRGRSFVPLLVEDGRVYALCGGEITCLDAANGVQYWHNALKGYGIGYAMIAGAPNAGVAAAVAEMEAAAAAGAAS